MIDNRKQQIVQKLLNHKVVGLFESIEETCNKLNISRTSIYNVCISNKTNVIKRSTRGYIFEYYDSIDNKTKEKVKQLKQNNGT